MSNAAAVKKLIADTTAAQARASDPATSAWVSANAGTGKTQVLTTRILRLLLAGTQPERILALTYTTAAAAEMSKRVFLRLGTWVTASNDELSDKLAAVLGRKANAEELERARHLFARAIEAPGGLKVQTIHAFCERLLQRFPLEAKIPPNFSILDDVTATEIRNVAADAVLLEAARDNTSELGRALLGVIEYAADDTFDSVLRDALSRRAWLKGLANWPPSDSGTKPDTGLHELYARVLGLDPRATAATIETAMAAVLDDRAITEAVTALGGGTKTDAERADTLVLARSAKSKKSRVDALKTALLTKEGAPRKSIATKAIQTGSPGVVATLERARDKLADLDDQRRATIAVDATLALVTLTEAVLTRFDTEKARRAALDFDDLIQKTAYLLRGFSNGAEASNTQWVLYKLDGGLEHILVDEAQDTSPVQWSVIEALANEFFTGNAVHDTHRTMFAVGDEKQSIYAFQGAAPEMFAATGKQFAAAAAAANEKWTRVPLNVSFRTTVPVLAAVDTVFADPAATPGLGASDATTADPIRHLAVRSGQAGHVEVWPAERYEKPADSDAFRPNDESPKASPASRLAARIARTIRGLLDSGEKLESENRAVRPADFLILVRRRRPFAGQMVAALKELKIPVAGADRLQLIDQIAVKDLIVLGDFLTLPEDDLALATVLKSPLFGLDDAALEVLAPKRKGLLWSALLERAKTDATFAEAARLLKEWRSTADYRPPYEFFARLLDDNGGDMRRRMLTRLGLEAADPIDEFLNEALRYDEGHPASMQGFLIHLRDANPEIKRDMEQGRDEVRVMTVHGSKGLEAPIVILPDTHMSAGGGRPGALLKFPAASLPDGIDELAIWPVSGSGSASALKAARQANTTAEFAELNRLLYVAMTRPRDRLYIAGYESGKVAGPDCWYNQITRALDPITEPYTYPDGFVVRRIVSGQSAQHETSKTGDVDALTPETPPDWATNRAPSEPQRSIPLAPSRLAPLETDDTGEPVERDLTDVPRDAPVLPPGRIADQNRFLRGTLTHALLQHLPTLPADTWTKAAAAFLETRARDLNAKTRASIARETLAVLTHKDFADLFGPNSKAEVPIVAELRPPSGAKAPYRLNGQIDRLAEIGNEVLIVDYKTNRPPPRDVAGVSEAYLLQLAAYRLALAKIYQGRTIRAAIVWTDGARLMEIPATDLDAAEQRLWKR